MTEITQPEWMKGFVPTPVAPDGRFQKGESGNPAGRPKGRVDRRLKLTQALADEAQEVTRVVLDAAKGGDLQACSLILTRVCPPLKANSERVQFELDPGRSLAQQAQQILQAVAEGRVDPETGKTLIGCLSSVAGIKASEELEQRIIILEARQVA